MYIVMAILVLIGDIISRSDLLNGDYKKRKKYICIWSAIIMFLFSVLHNEKVGIDMQTYFLIYQQDSIMSVSEIIQANSHFEQGRDKGFHILMHLLSYISKSPQLMLGVIGLTLAASICFLFYKYSVDPGLSILMFICFREYAFTVTGLRQALAMALTFYSINYIIERKPVKFCLFVIVAGLFHASAWIFFVAYPLAKWRKSFLFASIVSIVSCISILLGSSFVGSVMNAIPILGLRFSGKINAAEIATSGDMIFTIYFFITVLGLFYYYRKRSKKTIESDENSDTKILELNFSIITLFFCVLSFSYANIYRIGSYFMIGIFMLLPRILCDLRIDRSIRLVVRFIIIVLIVFQYFYLGTGAGIDKYYFMWQ